MVMVQFRARSAFCNHCVEAECSFGFCPFLFNTLNGRTDVVVDDVILSC